VGLALLLRCHWELALHIDIGIAVELQLLIILLYFVEILLVAVLAKGVIASVHSLLIFLFIVNN